MAAKFLKSALIGKKLSIAMGLVIWPTMFSYAGHELREVEPAAKRKVFAISRSAALEIYRVYGREKSLYRLIEIEEPGRRSFGKDGL